ncbi:MAG: outer membrane protein [Polaribacter sp.]|jgi:outer membrane protein
MTIKQKLLTVLVLSSVTLGASAAGKLAFINAAIVIEKSPQAQAASNVLRAEFEQRNTDLNAMLEKLQGLEKKYQTDGAIMSAEQKRKAEGEIVQSKRKFKFDQKSLQDDLQSRERALMQEIQLSISVVIREFGKKNGYDFIFTDGVAYVDEAVNITDEILIELAK